MAKGKFELYKDNSGEYRFRLKASNGQNIGASESYNAKSGAENGIESVRKNSADLSRYSVFEGNGGKWYFNLKAANHQVILSGQGYSSKGDAENGCQSVSNHAPDAELDDQT